MPSISDGRSRYKPYLSLSELGSKKSATRHSSDVSGGFSASWTKRKGDGLNAQYSRLAQQTGHTVLNRGRVFEHSTHRETRRQLPTTNQETVTFYPNVALPSKPFSNLDTDVSAVGLQRTSFIDIRNDPWSCTLDGGGFGIDQVHQGIQRGGFSRDFRPNGKETLAARGVTESRKRMPNWIRHAISGFSSGPIPSRSDANQQVTCLEAPVEDRSHKLFPNVYRSLVEDSITLPQDSFFRNVHFDEINDRSHTFGHPSSLPDIGSAQPATVTPYSPAFSKVPVTLKPFSTPGPHIQTQPRFRQKGSVSRNHSRFSPMTSQSSHHAFEGSTFRQDHDAGIIQSQTSAKPFSTPFIQADADFSIENRYAGKHRIDPFSRAPVTLSPIKENNEETAFSIYTMHDTYPSVKSLTSNDPEDTRGRVELESYQYSDEYGVQEGFELYRPNSDLQLCSDNMKPTSECHYQRFSNNLECLPNELVCNSSRRARTLGSQSQTISAGFETDGNPTLAPRRRLSQEGLETTSSIKGPCPNVALDVDALEAAAADMQSVRGSSHSFRDADVTMAHSSEGQEVEVLYTDVVSQPSILLSKLQLTVKETPWGQSNSRVKRVVLLPDLDTSITSIGERMQASLLECRKEQQYHQHVDASPQFGLESRKECEEHQSESIASFNDSDEQDNTWQTIGGGRSRHSNGVKNSDDFEAEKQDIKHDRQRADVREEELMSGTGKAYREMDFDSACAFVDEEADPGFIVWVDEQCRVDHT